MTSSSKAFWEVYQKLHEKGFSHSSYHVKFSRKTDLTGRDSLQKMSPLRKKKFISIGILKLYLK